MDLDLFDDLKSLITSHNGIAQDEGLVVLPFEFKGCFIQRGSRTNSVINEQDTVRLGGLLFNENCIFGVGYALFLV